MEGCREHRQLIGTESVAEFIPISPKVASRGAKSSVSWTFTTYATGSNWWQVLSDPLALYSHHFRPKIPSYRPTNLDPSATKGRQALVMPSHPFLFLVLLSVVSLVDRLPLIFWASSSHAASLACLQARSVRRSRQLHGADLTCLPNLWPHTKSCTHSKPLPPAHVNLQRHLRLHQHDPGRQGRRRFAASCCFNHSFRLSILPSAIF